VGETTTGQKRVPKPNSLFVPTRPRGTIDRVTAIRVIFDGKSFVPQQAVALPPQSEAFVIVAQDDPAAHAQLDASLRAYYAALPNGGDDDDDAWGDATSPQSHRAWDED
jgi:hypothetical protein